MGSGDAMTTFGERLTGPEGHEWPRLAASQLAGYDGSSLRELQDHSIDLTLGNSRALVRLAGDIDMVAAVDLTRLLESLDRLTTVEIHVDLAAVRFLDSSGLQPLIEATRRRRTWHLPPVLIGDCSTAVLRLLRILGVAANRVLDVDAWDQLAKLPPTAAPADRAPRSEHSAG
jgi:anti-anti-sigma factor